MGKSISDFFKGFKSICHERERFLMKKLYGILAIAAIAAAVSLTPALPSYSSTCAQPNAVSSASKAKGIDENKAKTIALKHVPGAKKENITDCEYDSKKNIYEIEIKYNHKEYEVDVDAKDGKKVMVKED